MGGMMGLDQGAVRAAQERVEQIAAGVEGIVGVYAQDLASGTEITYHADQVFPTASVMKIPILYELYRQVDAGRLDLQQRITWQAEHLVPGSGILQDLAFGLQPTLKDLATLMIIVSDNAATDLVLAQVGLDRVTQTMRELGLTNTAVPMTVRALLYSTVGLDAANAEHTYQRYQEQAAAKVIDWGSRAYADENNNLSTPREMANLLARIERRDGLSDESCAAMIDIMQRQKYTDRIPQLLPEGTTVAHKTGSLRGMRNDCGLVYAPAGPYTISLFAKHLDEPVLGVRALAEISKAIWEGFVGPVPRTRYGPTPETAETA